MTTLIIAFLVMLNPFAMFVYLTPIMEELEHKVFLKVLFKASFISFIIFALFLFFGEIIINKIFQINFEAFRIFGGIIIFSFAYFYIVKGERALIHMEENLDDLASEIALPFMVGAGTISLSILISHEFDKIEGILSLILILLINYMIIVMLKYLKDDIKRRKFKIAFDKNMNVLLRLNGFFVGAIGVNMIIAGINNLYF